MKKVLLLASLTLLMGCANQKPELADTQVVEGKSIIIPPEFNVLPESAAASED